ncbi:MAG TPA: pentapeptide repeat-containing protein [Azospirillaceae bacterium]|nr:pentapeptide repeat-containing protein [Azospirillaceae bacterium]
MRKAALLAKRAAFYQEQLAAQKVTGAQLTARKNRLDAFAITSLLLQADEGEAQRGERMLPELTWAVVYTTLFLLPLALYLAFQIFFLAYQSEAVTAWHRITVAGGAFLALAGAQRAGALRGERENAFLNHSLAITVFSSSFLIFTFPGERSYETTIARVIAPDFFRRVPNALRPRQPERLFVEAKKTGKLEDANTIDLAGRDFSGRRFRGAQFGGVNLRGAKLERAEMQGADLGGAKLQGANFGDAHLQGAYLSDAHLQSADLSDAKMQGAYLSRAEMQGANLARAGLQGAHLGQAKMQGADLMGASLQGADLGGAKMQGAYLGGASLQGADLSGANMQGVIMARVNLWRTHFKDGFSESAYTDGVYFYNQPDTGLVAVTEEQAAEWFAEVPNADQRQQLISQLTEFGDPFDDIAAWAETTAQLNEISRKISRDDRARIIAQSLCNDPDNTAAIRGVINTNRVIGLINRVISFTTFQSIISDKQRCPAAVKLTNEDWRQFAQAVASERLWLLIFEADEWFERAGLEK